MLHCAAHFGLTLQALVELSGFAFVLELLLDLDGLQRHTPADAPIAGKVNHAHGPLAEDRLDFVYPEAAAGFAGKFAHKLRRASLASSPILQCQ